MKKVMIAIGAALIVAGVVLSAWAFAETGFDFSKLGTVQYETNTYTPEAAFERIDVNVSQADIFLLPSADGKCSVVCAETDKVRHTAAVENGTLQIRDADRRAWYDRVAFFTKPISVTVYLPETRYASLKLSCSTGDVSLPADFSFGSLQIETSTGDVICEASVEDTKKAIAAANTYQKVQDAYSDALAAIHDIPMKEITGDFNDDGTTDLQDAQDLLVYYVKSLAKMQTDTVSATQRRNGDVDANGRLNAVDALHILRYGTMKMVGLSAEYRFPKQEAEAD